MDEIMQDIKDNIIGGDVNEYIYIKWMESTYEFGERNETRERVLSACKLVIVNIFFFRRRKEQFMI